MRPALIPLLVLSAPLSPAGTAEAEPAHVVAVEVRAEPGGTYRFDVTIRSDDMGWAKYADRWEVLGPDGTVLGTRTLAHPHVAEQPFTRALTGVPVPDAVDSVTVRAHDSQEGFGGAEMTVALP